MTLLGNENKEEATPKKGDFLRVAKDTLSQPFQAYIKREEDFNSIEDYTQSLFTDAWQIVEQLLKSSYRNGAQTGRARQSSGK